MNKPGHVDIPTCWSTGCVVTVPSTSRIFSLLGNRLPERRDDSEWLFSFFIALCEKNKYLENINHIVIAHKIWKWKQAAKKMHRCETTKHTITKHLCPRYKSKFNSLSSAKHNSIKCIIKTVQADKWRINTKDIYNHSENN